MSQHASVDRLRQALLSGWSGRVVLVLGIITPATVAVLISLPHSDVAWYLYVARRITTGARLYVDVVETNPPLVIWLDYPVVKLSDITGLFDFHILFVVCLLVSLGSLVLCNAWLKDAVRGAPESVRRFLVAILAFVFLVLARGSFGQREHIMMVVTIPYVLAAVARVGGAQVSRRRAIVTGAAAGIGFALKPHFLVALASIDGLVWLTSGKKWPRIRAESVTAYMVILGYGIIVVVFAKDYLDLARLLLRTYPNMDMMVWSDLLGAWSVRWGLAALAVAACVRMPLKYRRLALFVATGLVVMILVALFQRKGYSYHFYPSEVLTLLLFGVTISALMDSDCARSRSPGIGLGSLVALQALAAIVALSVMAALKPIQRPESDPQLRGLLPLVQRYAAEDNIMILSKTPYGFPLVNMSGVDWSSKFYSTWMLPGMLPHRDRSHASLRGHRSGKVSDAEQWFLAGLVDGLWKHPPALLVVDSRGWTDVASGDTLHFVEILSKDSRFVSLFSRYSYLSRVENLCVYIRDGTGKQGGAPDPHCP